MKKNSKHYIGYIGIISVIFYFLHVFLGQINYPNYNWLSQAVSDLTASQAPSKNIATIFSSLYGLTATFFTFLFFQKYKHAINMYFTIGSFSFFLMQSISFLGYLFFPLNTADFSGNNQDIMHMLVTIAVVILTILSLLSLMIGSFKSINYKSLGYLSLLAFIILMISSILTSIVPQSYFGLVERFSVFTVVFYTGILAIFSLHDTTVDNI